MEFGQREIAPALPRTQDPASGVGSLTAGIAELSPPGSFTELPCPLLGSGELCERMSPGRAPSSSSPSQQLPSGTGRTVPCRARAKRAKT